MSGGGFAMAEQEDLRWRRSSACEAGACLEMARSDDVVLIRRSDAPETILRISVPEWIAFLAGTKAGDFD